MCFTILNISTLNFANTTGGYNAANGYLALYSNTTGSANTAIGRRALYANTTGSYNTALGYSAEVSANNLTNATAIGYNTTATSSNQVRIGSGTVTSIGGYAAWTNFSDRRAKKNVRADVPGLEFINRLQPVTYNLDLDAIDGLLELDKKKSSGDEVLPESQVNPQQTDSQQGALSQVDLQQGELPQYELPQLEEELSPEMVEINKKAREAKEKQLQTGFIAQDVEEIAKSIGYEFSGVDVDEKASTDCAMRSLLFPW
jgi:hypothetical protein